MATHHANSLKLSHALCPDFHDDFHGLLAAVNTTLNSGHEYSLISLVHTHPEHVQRLNQEAWLFWSAADIKLEKSLDYLLARYPELRHVPGPDGMKPLHLAHLRRLRLDVWRKHFPGEVKAFGAELCPNEPHYDIWAGINDVYRQFPDFNEESAKPFSLQPTELVNREQHPEITMRDVKEHIVEVCLPLNTSGCPMQKLALWKGDQLECRGHVSWKRLG